MAKVTGVAVVKVKLLCWLNTEPTLLKTCERHEGDGRGLFKVPSSGFLHTFFPSHPPTGTNTCVCRMFVKSNRRGEQWAKAREGFGRLGEWARFSEARAVVRSQQPCGWKEACLKLYAAAKLTQRGRKANLTTTSHTLCPWISASLFFPLPCHLSILAPLLFPPPFHFSPSARLHGIIAVPKLLVLHFLSLHLLRATFLSRLPEMTSI